MSWFGASSLTNPFTALSQRKRQAAPPAPRTRGPAGRSHGPAGSKQLSLKKAAFNTTAWQLKDPNPTSSLLSANFTSVLNVSTGLPLITDRHGPLLGCPGIKKSKRSYTQLRSKEEQEGQEGLSPLWPQSPSRDTSRSPFPVHSRGSPLRRGRLKISSSSAHHSPDGFCKDGFLLHAPPAVTTPNSNYKRLVRSLPPQGSGPLWVHSAVLLQLPRLHHTVSWQQVQLGSPTRSWLEGALSSTFQLRKSRRFVGIFGSPNPSPRHAYTASGG